jgi:uncharacterized protein YdaL
MRHINIFFLLVCIGSFTISKAQNIDKDTLSIPSAENSKTKVLIITDVNKNIELPSTINAIKLYNLLGHFKTSVTVLGPDQYTSHEIDNHEVIFYLGNNPNVKSPKILMNDVLHTKKTVVWLNGGITDFCTQYNIEKKYGFIVSTRDTTGNYTKVFNGKKLFTRENGNLYLIHISAINHVRVIATAYSEKLKNEVPYIIKSRNFYYIADMPFMNVTQSDRYLLFADLLHDFIGENHSESHQAIVRIEDVTPLRDPNNLHKIADILSERHIPFLIGVVPFFVNPDENQYVSLSDRPELVNALKYCVEKGATIVMHGETHQYKGETGIDFEFWDGARKMPIANENQTQTEDKIEKGINECIKNGIYPLMWETPHYTASIEDYKIFSKYFGSAVERRMLNDNFKYGQFFPYIIDKDIYGQKIYPENLGYLPNLNKDSSELFITRLINNAKVIYNVRDGIASFFFHPFVNSDYLKEIADKICQLGFSFVDLRLQSNMVKTRDVVILSGSQKYSMNVDHAFLYEVYYNKNGEIEKRVVSKKPITGMISRKVNLKPDEFYLAEPMKESVKNDQGDKLKNPSVVNKIHT